MSDNNDAADDGRQMREIEVEVAATPEQVWEAITTNAGTSAWLFPTELEPHEGGTFLIHRQPYGGTAETTVTGWDPPRRFAYAEPQTAVPGGDEQGEPWTTEMLVEARDGGTCIVRVVSGFHRHGDAWEDFVDGAAEGWKGALSILQGYLAHFRGEPVALMDVSVPIDCPPDRAPEVAAELFRELGVLGKQPGDAFTTGEGVPELSGVVVGMDDKGALLRATAPAPALVEVVAFWMGGPGLLATFAVRYFGEGAADAAATARPEWQAWLDGKVPALTS